MTRPLVGLGHELKITDAPVIYEIMMASIPFGPMWSKASVQAEIESSQGLALRDATGGLEAFILLRDAIDAFEISYLATHARARKRGLMKVLILRAQAIATQNQRPLWLEVHEQNQAARALYEVMGFKETAKRPRYYADGGAAVLYNWLPFQG